MRAARRGVKVHILARPPHTLKAEQLIEGVGGLRIMQDRARLIGATLHIRRRPQGGTAVVCDCPRRQTQGNSTAA